MMGKKTINLPPDVYGNNSLRDIKIENLDPRASVIDKMNDIPRHIADDRKHNT